MDYTHNHVAPVTVGGVELARVVEIINDYTITFEDGQYAVNIVGGNSNIGDNVNVNQVSVRSANSAGLVHNTAIEFSSFNGGVTIDVMNGFNGTTFPIGTLQQPVNNLDDAKLIASVRGFNKLYIIGNITIDATDNVDDYIIHGDSHIKTTITIVSGASTLNSEFENATITGVLDGNASLDNCLVQDLTYVEGNVYNSILTGTVVLAGTSSSRLINCVDGNPDGDFPTIDMGGSGRDLAIAHYSGDIQITNLTGLQYVSVDLVSGVVWLDSTVTAGFFYLRGVGSLEDSSTNTIIDDKELINTENIGGGDPSAIADAVWDEPIVDHLSVGSTGEKLNEGSVDSATIALIADAVWDELLSEHVLDGSAGAYLGGINAGLIADAVWDEVIIPDHVSDDTSGKYLYDFASALASGDVYVSSSTESEIMMVRERLGDAGTLIAEVIVDEMGISTDVDTVFTMYQMIYEVNGVWLRTDTAHSGTNYYDGVDGDFDSRMGMITLHTSLPAAVTEVLIDYTYYRGLHNDTIDQFLTEAKLYVKKFTRKDYIWSDGLGVDPDEETQIALMAAASLAAKRCLVALSAGDILQLGFNFRLGDLEVENMVRGGGFHVQAMIDQLDNDIQQKLAMLGRGMYFVAPSSVSYGRDIRNYRRRGRPSDRSGIY